MIIREGNFRFFNAMLTGIIYHRAFEYLFVVLQMEYLYFYKYISMRVLQMENLYQQLTN